MAGSSPRRIRRLLLLASAAALVAGACGPKREALDAFRTQRSGSAATGLAAGPQGGTPDTQPPGSTGGPAPAAAAANPAPGAGGGAGAGTAAASGAPAPASATSPTRTATGSGQSATAAAPAATSAPTVSVSDTAIRIGVHAPQTISGVNVEPIIKLGALTNAYWSWVNDHGGINGRKVSVVLEDDGYDPGTARQACGDIVAKKVFFVSGTGGADQIVTCAQYVTGQSLLYMSLGVSEAGLIGNPYYFAYTLTYDQQSALVAKYIAHKLGAASGKKVALIRVNSANFDGPKSKFDTALKQFAGSGPVVDDAVDKNGNAQELSAECLKMQQAGAQIVTVLAAPTVFSELANACQSQAYKPQYVGWANTDGCPIDPKALGTPSLDGCISLSTFHQPDQVHTPIGDQCHQAWAKYAQSNSGDFPHLDEVYCGYFDVLRQAMTAPGRNLTTAAFTAALHQLAYDNGLFNPIAFSGGQVASHRVVVWKADANTNNQIEIDGNWETDF